MGGILERLGAGLIPVRVAMEVFAAEMTGALSAGIAG